jgi:hypothetical protein
MCCCPPPAKMSCTRGCGWRSPAGAAHWRAHSSLVTSSCTRPVSPGRRAARISPDTHRVQIVEFPCAARRPGVHPHSADARGVGLRLQRTRSYRRRSRAATASQAWTRIRIDGRHRPRCRLHGGDAAPTTMDSQRANADSRLKIHDDPGPGSDHPTIRSRPALARNRFFCKSFCDCYYPKRGSARFRARAFIPS